MDFFENRCSIHSDRILSGGILCQEDHEAETGGKGSIGWYSYHASGTSAYSGRLLPAADFQFKKTFWKFSTGKI